LAKILSKIHNLHVATMGSTLNKPPCWIIKIHHVDKYNRK
jgi:hypothetical protein